MPLPKIIVTQQFHPLQVHCLVIDLIDEERSRGVTTVHIYFLMFGQPHLSGMAFLVMQPTCSLFHAFEYVFLRKGPWFWPDGL